MRVVKRRTVNGKRGQRRANVEFGEGKLGRVDVDFLSGPAPTGSFEGPSAALANDKQVLWIQPPEALVWIVGRLPSRKSDAPNLNPYAAYK
jgi:hypothetical protein